MARDGTGTLFVVWKTEAAPKGCRAGFHKLQPDFTTKVSMQLLTQFLVILFSAFS